MDLAKVLIARSIRLFDLEEINPRGKKIEAAYQAIKDRYHFTQSPLEGAQKGVKFTGGRFNPGEGDVDIELDFYADGIVATSRSDTNDTDKFLDDLFGFIREQFGLGNESYVLKMKRNYRSDLVVHAPLIHLSRAQSPLVPLGKRIAQEMHLEPDDVEPQAIIFGSEGRNTVFPFERRANVPYSEHKYYSSAQVPTSEHWALLQEFEVLLTAASQLSSTT
jgi:hypothetical protein